MATKLDWNTVPKSGFKSGGGNNPDRREILRIKFTDDCSHIVRPVGPPVGFFSFFSPSLRRSFRCDLGNAAVAKQLAEVLNCEPSQKFAINVIDRSDNVIKIMEAPMTVYEQMVDVCSVNKTKAGGKNGGDWKVSTKPVKRKGGGQSRRYTANFLGKEPFTEEELARIENEDPSKNEWYILDDIYKEDDPESVKQLIEKFGSGSDSPAPKSYKKLDSEEDSFSKKPAKAVSAAKVEEMEDVDLDF